MSQHEYAFGRREGRRDKGPLLIIPRRLWGLWGALAGAVILVIFAVAAFAVMDRGPTAPSKLAEKNTAAPERTGARAIGASSRPKNDFRPPRSIAAAPPEPVVKPVPTPSAPPPDIRTVQAEAAPPVSPALPASSPIADRFPGPVASVKPARAVEPQPQIATPEEVTASVMERPELPRE